MIRSIEQRQKGKDGNLTGCQTILRTVEKIRFIEREGFRRETQSQGEPEEEKTGSPQIIYLIGALVRLDEHTGQKEGV